MLSYAPWYITCLCFNPVCTRSRCAGPRMLVPLFSCAIFSAVSLCASRGQYMAEQRREEEYRQLLALDPKAVKPPVPLRRPAFHLCLPEDCPAEAQFEYQPCRRK